MIQGGKAKNNNKLKHKNKNEGKYAVCILLMNDNKLKYLKAAEVLIYSLKHYGQLTEVDYVCITPDS